MTIPFNLSDAESYKAYFLAVATSNKLLGADQFLYGDIEIGQTDAADWQGKKLWAWPAQRARGAGQNDNYFLTREGTVWIGGPCGSEKFSDEDAFYFACEAIVKQVISKLIKDFTDAGISTNFRSYTIQRSDMEISATKFIGCELIFTFDDPDDFEFDENDWN